MKDRWIPAQLGRYVWMPVKMWRRLDDVADFKGTTPQDLLKRIVTGYIDKLDNHLKAKAERQGASFTNQETAAESRSIVMKTVTTFRDGEPFSSRQEIWDSETGELLGTLNPASPARTEEEAESA